MSTLLATVLEFLALILFHRVGLNHIAMGPCALLFSLLYQYSRLVPAAYNYRIFGVPLNNKSLMYLLALQVCISHIAPLIFSNTRGRIRSQSVAHPAQLPSLSSASSQGRYTVPTWQTLKHIVYLQAWLIYRLDSFYP